MLRDRVGIGYYHFYFTLLELCGEESSDQLKEEYVFHDSTIRNLWGVNLKKSERVANEMHSVGLLQFKKGEKNFQFTIPNFAKYLGRYSSKIDSNTPNKRKEKERKEKESKEKEIKEKKKKESIIHQKNKYEATPDNIIIIFNDSVERHSFALSKANILNKSRISAINSCLEGFPQMRKMVDWKNYFDEVHKSDFLTGKSSDWRTNFDWLINKANLLKVVEGNYKNNKKTEKRSIFADPISEVH